MVAKPRECMGQDDHKLGKEEDWMIARKNNIRLRFRKFFSFTRKYSSNTSSFPFFCAISLLLACAKVSLLPILDIVVNAG